MKKTEKFIVIRSTETGHYLMKYKNNDGNFAYCATWTDDIQHAATNTLESVEKQANRLPKVAEAFGGELLVVNATYEFETLDGKEPEDLTEKIIKSKREGLKNLLRGLLESNFDDNDDNDEED